MKVLAAISFCDIYTEQSLPEPERFQRAHRCISDKQFTEFVSQVPLCILKTKQGFSSIFGRQTCIIKASSQGPQTLG